MNSIKSTYGVYASLGNHDAGDSFNEIIDFLEQSNIKLLNECLALFGRVEPSPIGGEGEVSSLE